MLGPPSLRASWIEKDWSHVQFFNTSPYAYELELPASIGIFQVQHVSLLNPAVNYPLVGQRVDPPLMVTVDGEEEYQVSSVEEGRRYWNQLQCHIQWTGYD